MTLSQIVLYGFGAWLLGLLWGLVWRVVFRGWTEWTN